MWASVKRFVVESAAVGAPDLDNFVYDLFLRHEGLVLGEWLIWHLSFVSQDFGEEHYPKEDYEGQDKKKGDEEKRGESVKHVKHDICTLIGRPK
jgi:hypothetical protein